ncbi:uncharacterized protein LOC129584241 [Paramacrobiotus metropolitanus]|uniref:uncharacterized protein LOC129584241 n=1 Tax=Paramacrobiotus metropolitanus TaxID=2943436 RepID=UPI002445D35B|nr:uncharacterized protein LOC129584241 [Paramacrobiotus metropolitanus]
MKADVGTDFTSLTYKDAKPVTGDDLRTFYYLTCAYFQNNDGSKSFTCNSYEYCSKNGDKLDCAEVPTYGGSWSGDLQIGLKATFDYDRSKNKKRGEGCLTGGTATTAGTNTGNCNCKQAREEAFQPLSLDTYGPFCTADGKFAKRQYDPRINRVWCVDANYKPTSSPAVKVPQGRIPTC